LNPLLTASTITPPEDNRRAPGSSETAEFALGFGWGSSVLSRQVLEYALPEEDHFAITAEDRELPDRMFANTTAGLAALQSRVAYYMFDPSVLLFYLRIPSGRGKAKWADVADPRVLSFPQIGILHVGGADRVKPLLVGSESAPRDQTQPPAEGSTRVELSSPSLEADLRIRLKATFVEGVDEVFADGMESAFSRKVRIIILRYGNVAISAIDKVMQFERINAEVAAEALRQIGTIIDARSLQSRLTLLSRKLQSLDPRIRDAASLGIAALDDPVAIREISRAIERENSLLIKRNLQLVLDQLEATKQRCAS
jgi:hypothetical protein